MGSELFRYLDMSYLAMLSKCSSSIQYPDKAVIRNIDTNGSFMYVVKKGQVIETRGPMGGDVIHTVADCITCLGGQLTADAADAADGFVELMTWHVSSLHALLGATRGSDFFWRCELLCELRRTWSHHLGFASRPSCLRSCPEAIARACIIMTFPDTDSVTEFLSPSACESIEWFMFLEGTGIFKASGEYCSLKTYDSMIVSDIPSSLEPDNETGPSPATLALLLKDAILLGEEGDLDFKLNLIQQ
eukprot:symbB.v1.2.038929.t1/scaffold6245.1/size19697/1